jgi:glutathione reductase (NADPH)
MTTTEFDVLVIGTGEGGTTAAQKCARSGRHVAIVDVLPYGGTCALRGCDPKKVFIGAAETVARSQQLLGHGLATAATVDWPDLMRFKNSFTDKVPAGRKASLQKAGIATYHGLARFTGSHAVQVGEQELRAKQFILATGARPRRLGIPGEKLLLDSTAFLELPELPTDLTLVGGGYIAFEFAHLVARCGVAVRILHRGARPLEHFDPDLVAYLVAASREAGIEVVLNTAVVGLERQPDGRLRLQAESGGQAVVYKATLAVHAAGREPNLAALDLDRAGIAYGPAGVTVNEFLQSTTHPDVYAVGDAAASGLPLTPIAAKAAFVAASNLLKGNHTPVAYGVVPTTVFSHPPLAAVGLSEAEATRQGLKFSAKSELTTDWFTARRLLEPVSAYKVLVEEGTGQVLGAHLLGPNADEVINLFAVAMHARHPARELQKLVFAYPTSASDIVYML